MLIFSFAFMVPRVLSCKNDIKTSHSAPDPRVSSSILELSGEDERDDSARAEPFSPELQYFSPELQCFSPQLQKSQHGL